MLDSNGGQARARLIDIHMERTISTNVRIKGSIRPLSRATTVRCQPKLGKWVSRQRSNYRLHQEGKPSPMTEECIRELESPGFKFGYKVQYKCYNMLILTRHVLVAHSWKARYDLAPLQK